MVLTLPDSYNTPWDVANITRFVYYSLAWCYHYQIRTLLPGMVLTLPYSCITPWYGANITRCVLYCPGMVLTLPDSYIIALAWC